MLVLGFVNGDRALPRLAAETPRLLPVAEAAEASDVANCVYASSEPWRVPLRLGGSLAVPAWVWRGQRLGEDWQLGHQKVMRPSVP